MVGGHDKYADIQRRHWERMAADCRFPADEAVAIVAGLIGRLPDAAPRTAAALRAPGVDHPVVGKLTDLITRHCASVARQWGFGTALPSMPDDFPRPIEGVPGRHRYACGRLSQISGTPARKTASVW